MIYIVDIDQTICHTPTIDGKSRYDLSTPYVDRIEKINKLFDEGHEIIYWTARGGSTGIDWTEVTKQHLQDWNCKFTKLNMNKPSYDIWIDDKAFNSEEYFK